MKILNKILIFVVLLTFSVIITNAQTGTLKGKVYDSKTKEGIAFANIVLLQDSKIIGGTASDCDGNYKIIAPAGKYDLKTTYVGYKPIFIKNIVIITNKETIIDLSFEPTVEVLKSYEIHEYKVPLIQQDQTSSGQTMTSEEINKYSKKESEVIKNTPKSTSSSKTNVQSGLLTAGELHDFSKWTLWNDIATKDLAAYQKQWKLNPLHRYTLQVENKNGTPLVDAIVSLKSKDNQVVWSAHTDNTGKAELWLNMNDSTNFSKNKLQLTIKYKNTEKSITDVKGFSKGINFIKFEEECEFPNIVDIAFVVDATGSMQDEIDYLNAEFIDIINKSKDSLKQVTLNTAMVLYRDKGDEYITKKSNFTSNHSETLNFIKTNNEAGGGGDYEEAVEIALDEAINNLTWSNNARARILFLVLDAPPHDNDAVKNKIQNLLTIAASKGIKIVPVVCSGIDKSTEFLMRSLALGTNGTYVFLTDHSGIGNGHIEPTTDKYEVETLNQIMRRIILQNAFVPECKPLIKEEKKDTLVVTIPDTNKITKDTTITITNPKDTNITKPDTIIKPDFDIVKIKYYPNPTRGELTVELPTGIDVLYVSDISGKLIQRNEVQGQEVVKLDLSMFPSGVYFIKYEYKPNKWASGKVILIRN